MGPLTLELCRSPFSRLETTIGSSECRTIGNLVLVAGHHLGLSKDQTEVSLGRLCLASHRRRRLGSPRRHRNGGNMCQTQGRHLQLAHPRKHDRPDGSD